MKKRIILLLLIVILLNSLLLTGCWNYREVERLTIVAGLAIDKGKKSRYRITTEIVEIGGGQEAKPLSRQISMEGNTIFDAVRNEISLSGQKLYWAHTKVIILGKEIAKDGTLAVMDWINRDSETRADVLIFVSNEKSAAAVFDGIGTTNQIISFELADMARNGSALSKAPIRELSQFVNELESPGIVSTLPAIHLVKTRNQKTPEIMGTAIFKKDKLIGFLNGEKTKDLLFVLNEIKGGLLIIHKKNDKNRIPFSLEIFNNNTKIVSIIKNNTIAFQIHINTIVAVDEIGGKFKVLDEKNIKQLEKQASADLKSRVETCVKDIQKEYGTDVFGFGAKLREDKPKIWKQKAINWDKAGFKEAAVNVDVKVHIKGSGMVSNTIEKGD